MHTFLDSDIPLSGQGPGIPAWRSRWTMVVSAAVHGLALLVLCWRVTPMFVKPRLLAHGSGGNSTPVAVALYFPKDVSVTAERHSSMLSFPATPKQAKKSKSQKRLNVLDRDQPRDSAEAGSRFGSAFDSSLEGDEIRPGFAVSFTDPRVYRWQMPNGLQGDVVVELTIDEQGNVVEEKLLQGLGYGVDERVIATLRDWHFRPATRNGVAIPFKYDAHFHFPS